MQDLMDKLNENLDWFWMKDKVSHTPIPFWDATVECPDDTPVDKLKEIWEGMVAIAESKLKGSKFTYELIL